MIVSVLLLTVFRMSCASQPKPRAYWLPPAMGATPAAPPLDPKEGVNMVPPNFGTQAESTFFKILFDGVFSMNKQQQQQQQLINIFKLRLKMEWIQM